MPTAINPTGNGFWNWSDGWGAVGIGALSTNAVKNMKQYRDNTPQRRVDVKWDRFTRAVHIKEKVDSKVIKKEVGAKVCYEMGVDPQFLDNKDFKETWSGPKPPKPPFASISSSNNNSFEKTAEAIYFDRTEKELNSANSFDCCDTNQPQKSVEWAQVAEVGPPQNCDSSIAVANQKNDFILLTTVFIVSAGLYFVAVKIIKNTNWYYKNFVDKDSIEDQKNFNYIYEKINQLENSQKKILENQSRILFLLEKK